jgi:ribosomal protein L20
MILQKKKKFLLKQTRSFQGPRSTNLKLSNQAYIKAKYHSYRSSRKRRIYFNTLLLSRINSKLNTHFNWNVFVSQYKKKNINLSRNIWFILTIQDPSCAFKVSLYTYFYPDKKDILNFRINIRIFSSLVIFFKALINLELQTLFAKFALLVRIALLFYQVQDCQEKNSQNQDRKQEY